MLSFFWQLSPTSKKGIWNGGTLQLEAGMSFSLTKFNHSPTWPPIWQAIHLTGKVSEKLGRA